MTWSYRLKRTMLLGLTPAQPCASSQRNHCQQGEGAGAEQGADLDADEGQGGEEAAALLGVAPEDCVVVEDSANGILAARNAGMRTVGFHGASDTGQDTSAADYVVSSHLELTALPLFTQAQ